VPTSQQQAAAFFALRGNLREDGNWEEFWKRWDGFIWTIIRKKLFFAPDLWEDCKSLVDIKVFRYIERFDESREISPWLARVITSCCADTRERNCNGSDMPGREQEESRRPRRLTVSLDAENTDSLVNTLRQPESGDDLEHKEMSQNLWRCVGAAMEEMGIDPRQKVAFELFYRYERKLREIAAAYDLPETTVNNWPGSVLKKIRPHIRAGMEKLGYTSAAQR
jgi:RNA polymerase sigma factor (sigma-70 family)